MIGRIKSLWRRRLVLVLAAIPVTALFLVLAALIALHEEALYCARQFRTCWRADWTWRANP